MEYPRAIRIVIVIKGSIIEEQLKLKAVGSILAQQGNAIVGLVNWRQSRRCSNYIIRIVVEENGRINKDAEEWWTEDETAAGSKICLVTRLAFEI